MVYVYELYDTYGSIVYVGETIRPQTRLYEHTKKTSGKFYGRDLTMHIVAEFSTKKDAFGFQNHLQKEYGMVSDLEKMQNRASNNVDKATNSRKGINVSELYGTKISQALQKLNKDQAEIIRSRYKTDKISLGSLGREYGVSAATIHKIIHNKTYN